MGIGKNNTEIHKDQLLDYSGACKERAGPTGGIYRTECTVPRCGFDSCDVLAMSYPG
jgi:hypothetical protein